MRGLASSFVLAISGIGTADAHLLEHPKILRLGVTQDRVVLSVVFDVNPGEDSRRARHLFDANGDGTLGGDEQSRMQAYLKETSMLFLEVLSEGNRVPPTIRSAEPHRLDQPVDATDSIGISLLLEYPIPASPRIDLELRDRNPDATKLVPLTVDVGTGWFVELASQGEMIRATRELQRVWLGLNRPLKLHLLRRPAGLSP